MGMGHFHKFCVKKLYFHCTRKKIMDWGTKSSLLLMNIFHKIWLILFQWCDWFYNKFKQRFQSNIFYNEVIIMIKQQYFLFKFGTDLMGEKFLKVRYFIRAMVQIHFFHILKLFKIKYINGTFLTQICFGEYN